ncbi:hypothetical protein [Erwinia tasmaniensis]|uniref:hypothetical protein n=1 Tax=Erwinia tasmaniensis TaxID=338565 RepID=UPI003A4D9CA8
MKISIATEDVLTEEVITKILSFKGRFEIVHKLGRKGCGFLTNKLSNFNELAKTHNVLVFFDLDLKPNPNAYKSSLEGKVANKNGSLHILISVREVESWVLADRIGLSAYFNISRDKIERDPDVLPDPKEKIINLAKASKNPLIKKGIPPKAGAAAKVGISYNSLLTNFIWDGWDFTRALEHSQSLRDVSSLIDAL